MSQKNRTDKSYKRDAEYCLCCAIRELTEALDYSRSNDIMLAVGQAAAAGESINVARDYYLEIE